MMHNIWYGKLRQRLAEKSHQKSKWILEGGPPDYRSYKYDVGYLQGLADALIEAEEVDREMLGMRPELSMP